MRQLTQRARYRLLLAFALPFVVALLALVGPRVVPADAGHANRPAGTTSALTYTPVSQFGATLPPPMLGGPEGIAVDPLGNVFVADPANGVVYKFSSSGDYLTQWVAAGTGTTTYSPDPTDIAVDTAGNVFVTDYNNDYVYKFSPSATSSSGYRLETQWLVPGTGTTTYSPHPSDIAVDTAGNVFVTDFVNDYVYKFSPWATSSSGYHLETQWQLPYTGADYSPSITGIAVDTAGNVFVLDHGDDLVAKFSPSATSSSGYRLETQWNVPGTGTTYSPSTTSIAVDTTGNVFVTDYANGCVYKFSPSATSSSGYRLETQWPVATAQHQPSSLDDLAVDARGNVYIVDANVNLVLKFSPSTTDSTGYSFATQWGYVPLNAPQGVALDSLGNVNIANALENMIVQYTPSGRLYYGWGAPNSDGFSIFNAPVGIAIDSMGSIYVSDTGDNRIQRFDSFGNYQIQWGSADGTPGTGNGQFNEPWGVAVDTFSNVYVADFNNNLVQKFNSSGQFVTQWGTPPSVPPTAAPAVAATARRSGSSLPPRGPRLTPTIVAAGPNHQVRSSNAERGPQPCSTATPTGQFDRPVGVAVGASGNVYVTEYGNNRVDKLDSAGNCLIEWGSQGWGDGQFQNPDGIAIDTAGNVYVADFGGNRVEKFDSFGNYLTQWGSPSAGCPNGGSGLGQFNCPTGIAVDAAGNVYVADQNNNRVQVFAPVPPPTDTPTATASSTPTTTPGPGTPVVVTVVASATVSVWIPPESTPIAQVVVTAPSVTPTIVPVSPQYQPILAIQIQATGANGQPVSQLSAPATFSIRFTPSADTNALLAQIYGVDQNGQPERLATHVVSNGDGTFTATAQTSFLSSFVMFAPGLGTPVPDAYLPAVMNAPKGRG